jgi:uncharacterized membrane protein YccC
MAYAMNNEQENSEVSRLWPRLRPLIELSEKRRPLGFLLVAALAVGLPVLMGAALDRFSLSILASMGGLVILYMQQTALSHRLTTLAVCSFGFMFSFSFGALTSFNPFLSALTLGLTVFVVTVVCRFYRLPPPGSFFFILVACLARTLPFEIELVAERLGILLLGCMGATLLGLLYTLLQGLRQQQCTVTVPPPMGDGLLRERGALMLEAGVIALFIGGGYLLAMLVGLDNPYWVPVSTAAIMQGVSFRAVWHRNVHRIVGTVIGMGLVWLLFSFSPSPWVLAGLIMLLSFVIETLITRNYGLAVIFITPLTVIFADASLAIGDTQALVMARLVDIVFGSIIGCLGGWLLNHPRWFQSIMSAK